MVIKMKIKILALTAALALVITAAGCGQKDTGTDGGEVEQNVQDVSDNYAEGASENVDMKKVDGTEASAQSSDSDSATLEESEVAIKDAKVVDADGKKVIIVSYKFTNNSANAESFTSMMSSDAFQDGMAINHSVINTEIEGFDSDSTAERIDPGKTITVQEAYTLANETSPVEVRVSEFHSESGASVTKTFNLQ